MIKLKDKLFIPIAVVTFIVVLLSIFLEKKSDNSLKYFFEIEEFKEIVVSDHFNKKKYVIDIKDEIIFQDLWQLFTKDKVDKKKLAGGADIIINLLFKTEKKEYHMYLYKNNNSKYCHVLYNFEQFTVVDDEDIISRLSQFIFENGQIVIEK